LETAKEETWGYEKGVMLDGEWEEECPYLDLWDYLVRTSPQQEPQNDSANFLTSFCVTKLIQFKLKCSEE
jgi:hypothetical protein